MDNDAFTPPQKEPIPERPRSRAKDPYVEPPVKDFSHLLKGQPKQKSAHHRLRILLIVVITAVLAAACGAAIVYDKHSMKHVIKQQTAVKTKTNQSNPATVPMTSYSSTGFGLTLSHPKTWTVTDDGSTSITLLSPVMQLTNATGQKVDGKVVIIVQQQGQIPTAFGTADAAAVLPSQLIKYTNPGSTQRAQTYVSFLQYSSATITGTLDGIYVTGNYGYQKDQAIPTSDVTNLNPLITVTFGQCTTKACTSIENLRISATSWSQETLSKPILAILESLSFT
jgi:hypothetical protein